jgi:hypothetical protein
LTVNICPACHGLIGPTFACVEREGVTTFGQDIEDQGIEPGDRCRDCGVIDGGIHHVHCCVAWCTDCDHQRLCCGCDDPEEALV